MRRPDAPDASAAGTGDPVGSETGRHAPSPANVATLDESSKKQAASGGAGSAAVRFAVSGFSGVDCWGGRPGRRVEITRRSAPIRQSGKLAAAPRRLSLNVRSTSAQHPLNIGSTRKSSAFERSPASPPRRPPHRTAGRTVRAATAARSYDCGAIAARSAGRFGRRARCHAARRHHIRCERLFDERQADGPHVLADRVACRCSGGRARIACAIRIGRSGVATPCRRHA